MVFRIGARATLLVAACALLFGILVPQTAALAGTTGTIQGTVVSSNGAPLPGVKVTASSASQVASTTTDAHGFYSLIALLPDTYTLTFELSGYLTVSAAGVSVLQDESQLINERLQLVSLKTIAHIQTAGASNLVNPNQGSDVYNVTGQELTAATNPGDLLNTLYQYADVAPGVTSTGFPAQPRVRGGQVTDLGYEFDGIPIADDMTGFFTTNLSNIGVQNLEVYTGGLEASEAANGTGYLNSVAKVGTNPGFMTLAAGMTGPEYNHYLTFQGGYATPDHRWSYYVGYDSVSSINDYANGQYTFPGVLLWSADGPGPVTERDLIGNFHYKPDPNDDIQFLITNSYADFDFNYLIDKGPGQSPALGFAPCPGAVGNPATWSNASGGTAPDGQSCPIGLYWYALANGTGNNWYHYGGLGKLQWTHNINDHSFFTLKFDENFNAYNFDQPIGEPNTPSLENVTGTNGWNWAWWLGVPGTCPAYPYKPGSPVQISGDGYDICAFDDGTQNFYGNRTSNIYQGALDYQDLINEHVTVKFGVSNQLNFNTFDYLATNAYTYYNGVLSFPQIYQNSSYPTSSPHVYGEAQIRFGNLMIDPGLLYAAEHYGFPQGGMTESIWNPTFNGTYTFNQKNVMRFSYGSTSSFIGSAFVYATPNSLLSEFGDIPNPFAPGNTFKPQLNHSADLMWEHQFDSETSLRFGPYWNKATNYFAEYTPVIGYTPAGIPIFSSHPVYANNQRHQALGFEFGLNRVDHHPTGLSMFLTATYDNFWDTTGTLAASYINYPLPDSLVNEGVMVRDTDDPLWETSFLFDYHMNGLHIDPWFVYQGDFFYDGNEITGCPSCVPATPYELTGKQQIASGFWNVNLQIYQDIGPKKNFFVGGVITNLTNNYDNANLIPCESTFGTGCFPYFSGPQSGVLNAPGTNIYQNFTQEPRTFEVYAGVRLGNTAATTP